MERCSSSRNESRRFSVRDTGRWRGWWLRDTRVVDALFAQPLSASSEIVLGEIVLGEIVLGIVLGIALVKSSSARSSSARSSSVRSVILGTDEDIERFAEPIEIARVVGGTEVFIRSAASAGRRSASGRSREHRARSRCGRAITAKQSAGSAGDDSLPKKTR